MLDNPLSKSDGNDNNHVIYQGYSSLICLNLWIIVLHFKFMMIYCNAVLDIVTIVSDQPSRVQSTSSIPEKGVLERVIDILQR